MKTRRLAFFTTLPALCLALALSAPAQEQEYREYSHVRIVRLSLVDGDVQIRRAETGEWETALLNLPIQQGYTLSSGDGRAEVELESGATIRIAENTTVEFVELALGDGARITRLALVNGTATFYANLSREDVYRVSTAHLDVEIPDDARFRVDVGDSGSYVTVLKGNVRVSTGSESYKVSKGRTLAFYANGSNEVKIARSAEPDEFDRWVADRDEVVTSARSDALRYVNSPYSYGLADLSRYGAWYRDATYGYVWVPLGTSAGWSPFFHGRWLHVGGFGWSWVSYEPWGWLPYHYGSWVFTGTGWAWLPRNFHYGWHPGRVTWYQFGNQIGWCPTNPQGGGPQGGVVVINSPGGAMTGARNRTTRMNPEERPQMLSRPPLPRDGRIRQIDDPGTQEILRERRGEAQGTARTGGTATTGGSTTTTTETEARPSRRTETRVPSGIVYDPETRRFVNNPRVPVQTYPGDETRAPSTTMGRPAPSAREVAPSSRQDAPEAPARTTVQVPTRSVRGDRLEESRPSTTTVRPTPPPSTRSQNPPARVETPRPSPPPPRAESPRPTPPPPPRAETPRPSPPPQRPAEVRPPPPPPQPRGESRPTPPPKPERPNTKD